MLLKCVVSEMYWISPIFQLVHSEGLTDSRTQLTCWNGQGGIEVWDTLSEEQDSMTGKVMWKKY